MWKTIGLSFLTAVRSSRTLPTNAAASLRSRVPTTTQRALFQLRFFHGGRIRLEPEASKLASTGTRARTATTETEGTHSEGTEKAATKTKTTKTGTTSKTAGRKEAPEKAKGVKSAAKKAAPKKAAKKAAPKKIKKITLTEDQKVRRKIKELRKKALYSEEPKGLPGTNWFVFLADEAQSGSAAAAPSAEMGLKFKELGPAEVQRLEAIATQNKEANKKAHEEWIASKTPAEIYWANSARAALSRLTKVTKRRLTDDRLPKRGPTPWGLYLQSKMRSEGLGDKTPQEKMKILVTEYRALPEAEKEPLIQKSLALMAQYRVDITKIMDSSPKELVT